MIKTYLESWGMSVSLLAPATDLGFSRGLCGQYDLDPENDLHNKKGDVIKSRSDRLAESEFVQTWRY